jgi:hypothetical protein
VARNARAHAEELERDGRLSRVHRVVAADRQEGDLRPVEARDQLHVAEHVGVAGHVDARAVLELEHESARLAGVGAVVR